MDNVEDVAMSNNVVPAPVDSADSSYEPSTEQNSIDTVLDKESVGISQPLRANPARAARKPQSGEGSNSTSEKTLHTMQLLLERVLVVDPQQSTTKAQIAFRAQNPPFFTGKGPATEADEWIRHMEEIFWSLDIHNDQLRMKTAPNCLRGDAAGWWHNLLLVKETRSLTWEAFKVKFLGVFFPRHERHAMRLQFYNLTQGSGTVTSYR